VRRAGRGVAMGVWGRVRAMRAASLKKRGGGGDGKGGDRKGE